MSLRGSIWPEVGSLEPLLYRCYLVQLPTSGLIIQDMAGNHYHIPCLQLEDIDSENQSTVCPGLLTLSLRLFLALVMLAHITGALPCQQLCRSFGKLVVVLAHIAFFHLLLHSVALHSFSLQFTNSVS